MRLALTLLGLVGCVSLTACTITTPSEPMPPPDDEPMPIPAAPASPPPADRERQPFATPKPPAPAADDTLREIVYVLMHDRQRHLWFCTGTLVAEDRVVTAAHCLEPQMFVRYEIVAPLAPGRPRVSASHPKSFGGHYDDVANPDIGFLTLDAPIDLPRYAELTDVTAQVEAGEELSGVAVVRTAEQPEAPLAMSGPLALSSTVRFGYEHGFGTPYFSSGGDSGAGLFLVESGKPTHKLIAVARQPEPDRDLDHFTRVDAEFLAWYAAH